MTQNPQTNTVTQLYPITWSWSFLSHEKYTKATPKDSEFIERSYLFYLSGEAYPRYVFKCFGSKNKYAVNFHEMTAKCTCFDHKCTAPTIKIKRNVI